jgi:hypothetical protein
LRGQRYEPLKAYRNYYHEPGFAETGQLVNQKAFAASHKLEALHNGQILLSPDAAWMRISVTWY